MNFNNKRAFGISQPSQVRLPTAPAHMLPSNEPPPPPPPPQAAPVLGIAASYEIVTNTVDWSRAQESSVYITSRRWRACDVYVEFDAGIANAFILSVFVYAVAQGSRTLVASGRIERSGVHPASNIQWIVAARSVAERYEVTTRYDGSTLGPALPGKLKVTVAASDEMTSPPSGIGTLTRFGAPSGVKFAAVQTSVPPRLEVVHVQGVNEAGGAPLYLMLFDNTSPNFGTLSDPIMVWPLGSLDGDGAYETISFRCALAPALAISSTAGVYTPAALGAVSLTVR